MEYRGRKLEYPYVLMLLVYFVMVITAFAVDAPSDILKGLGKIVVSRGVLITDYIAVGGMGATLVNAAAVGTVAVLMLHVGRMKPNGSLIMALWLTTGFAMMGKNLFNMLPISFGVLLYARIKREPFTNFTLVALLSATLSPVVSGFTFHPALELKSGLPLGICMGVIAGFVFSAVSAFTMRVHSGYTLYNLGFAGGLISTFIVSGAESVGLSMPRELIWSDAYDIPLSIMLYVISAGLIVAGLFQDGTMQMPAYRRLMRHSGRLVTDYYILFGDSVFFNMGLLGVLGTTLMIVLGADLNGASLCGIFTMIGFAAFGKHVRNVIPILVGAVICTHINLWNPTDPSNTLAILFSTTLAPIAGQFGWGWGVAAGFLHVNTVMHIAELNSGLNLYNNGYASGFVALLLVPIIQAFQKQDP